MVNLEHVKIVKQGVKLGTNKKGSTPSYQGADILRQAQDEKLDKSSLRT